MAPRIMYTVRASYGLGGWLTVTVDGMPSVGVQARTRHDVAAAARQAIALALEADEGSFDLAIAVEERRRFER